MTDRRYGEVGWWQRRPARVDVGVNQRVMRDEINTRFDVPADFGVDVTVDARPGVVVGFRTGELLVRLGDTVEAVHPVRGVEYFPVERQYQ